MSLSVSKTKTRMWSNGRNANQPTNKGQSREKKTKNRICKLEAVCVSVTIGKLGVGREGGEREGGGFLPSFKWAYPRSFIIDSIRSPNQIRMHPDTSGCVCVAVSGVHIASVADATNLKQFYLPGGNSLTTLNRHYHHHHLHYYYYYYYYHHHFIFFLSFSI